MRIFMFEEFGISVFSVFEINDNAKKMIKYCLETKIWLNFIFNR